MSGGDSPVKRESSLSADVDNDRPDVLSAAELAEGDVGTRAMITGAKALRRSPSKDTAYAVALKKALTKDRHQTRSGKGRGAPKKSNKNALYLLFVQL